MEEEIQQLNNLKEQLIVYLATKRTEGTICQLGV